MIIHSLLDNDQYKITMLQAVLHNYYSTQVCYRYKCRTAGFKFTSEQVKEIQTEVKYLCSLSFNDKELYYLSNLRFISQDTIAFLRYLKLDYRDVTINTDAECGLNIEIKGPMAHTILFEVPILAIVSEIASRTINPLPKIQDIKNTLRTKLDIANDAGFSFADFGTRRRYSKDVQTLIVAMCATEAKGFVGTSNMLLACANNIAPIGTMAHEWLMMHQALNGVRLIDFQKEGLQTWQNEYRGDLGIALTDTVGVDAFLKDFDLYFCKLFDGVRQDSGDPFEFGEKIIDHYDGYGIDPRSKTIIFSDGLNFDLMEQLDETFYDRIKVSFGIGTNLTNDVGPNKPLSMVIKMVECNGQPVAKISDSPGKSMLGENSEYLKLLKYTFDMED